MATAITITREGRRLRVDGRDVGQAMGLTGAPDPESAHWRDAADAYVDAHPRQGRHADAQRMQVLRTLAAGPATSAELLAAMREAGWVGASDLENRLRDLRGEGARGAGRTVVTAIESDGDVHRLPTPFPSLTDAQLRAVGFAKSLVARQQVPLAAQALQTLDGVMPGIGMHTGERGAATMTLRAEDMHRFESARVQRRPVDVTYFSMNSGREATYRLVPVAYVPVGPSLKAVCIVVGGDGGRREEWQFALDRVRAVRPTDLAPLDADATALRTEVLDVEVTDALYRIMRDRNQFDIASAEAVQTDVDRWRVTGEFPVALGWDVMEQMCAWAGQVVVHRPFWLVNAVTRRLRAGLRAMEEAELELVKPDPSRRFADLEEAVYDADPVEPPPPGRPRKITPPGR